jgi:hypothetical protein
MTLSPSFTAKMRDISNKSLRENQSTHFLFSDFFSKNRAVYEIMQKNLVVPEGPQMTSQHGTYALHAG